jgi:hypothetical protein
MDSFACLMLSKRDSKKGYVLVKADWNKKHAEQDRWHRLSDEEKAKEADQKRMVRIIGRKKARDEQKATDRLELEEARAQGKKERELEESEARAAEWEALPQEEKDKILADEEDYKDTWEKRDAERDAKQKEKEEKQEEDKFSRDWDDAHAEEEGRKYVKVRQEQDPSYERDEMGSNDKRDYKLAQKAHIKALRAISSIEAKMGKANKEEYAKLHQQRWEQILLRDRAKKRIDYYNVESRVGRREAGEDRRAARDAQSAEASRWERVMNWLNPKDEEQDEEQDEAKVEETEASNPVKVIDESEETGVVEHKDAKEAKQAKRLAYEETNNKRSQYMIDLLSQEYQKITEEDGLTGPQAIAWMRSTIAQRLVDTTNMDGVAMDQSNLEYPVRPEQQGKEGYREAEQDYSEMFLEDHEENPIITPAMNIWFKTQIEALQEDGEDLSRLEELSFDTTVVDEFIPFALGMFSKDKTPRPDLVAHHMHKDVYGDDRRTRVAHPLAEDVAKFVTTAIETHNWDLEEVKLQEARKEELRRDSMADREEIAEGNYGDVPPYAPPTPDERDATKYIDYDEPQQFGVPTPYTPRTLHHEEGLKRTPHQVAMDAAYKDMFRNVEYEDGVVGDKTGKKHMQNLKTHQWVNEMMRYIEQYGDDFLDNEVDLRDERTKRPSESHKNQHLKNVAIYHKIWDMVNESAKQTLNEPSINSVASTWGRPRDSGSDPIMTPALSALGEALGVSVTDSKGQRIHPNAPDIMSFGPTRAMSSFDREEAVYATDPHYRKEIITNIAAMIDDKKQMESLHPAIGRNTDISRAVFEMTGFTGIAAQAGLGREADQEGVLAIQQEGQDDHYSTRTHGGVGTTMTDFLTASMVDSNGQPLYMSPDDPRWADKSQAEKKQHNERVKNAQLHAMKKWRNLQPRHDEDKWNAGKEAQYGKMAYHSMKTAIELAQRQLANKEITEHEYVERYGDLLKEGGGGFQQYLNEGQEVGEIGDVDENHFLYADRAGNILDEEGRKEELKRAADILFGVTGIIEGARRTIHAAGGDGNLIADEGDLTSLFKPASRMSVLGQKQLGPKQKPTEQQAKIDAITSSHISSDWVKEQLAKNQILRDKIRKSGFSMEQYVSMAAKAFGAETDMSQKGVSAAMTHMVNMMAIKGGEYASSQRILKVLMKLREDENDTMLHHSKVQKQTDSILNYEPNEDEDEDDEESHACIGCVGSPERFINQTAEDAQGGGKSGRLSPYKYKNHKIPDISKLDISDDDRTIPTLVSLYHDLQGLEDTEKGWEQAENIISSMGWRGARSAVNRILQSRSKSVSENISAKYGLGFNLDQTKPWGIAADLEDDKMLQQYYKHLYKGDYYGEAKKEASRLELTQKQNIYGALRLYGLVNRLGLKPPELFQSDDGKEVLTQRAKLKFIKDLLKLSGDADTAKAENQYRNHMEGNLRRNRTERFGGFNQLEEYAEGLRIPKFIRNREEIKNGKGSKEELKMMRQENKKAMDAYNKSSNKTKWGVLVNRYIRGLKKRDELKANIEKVRSEENDFGGKDRNAEIATLTYLYRPIREMSKQLINGDITDGMDAINELHAKTFIDPKTGFNTGKTFEVKMKHNKRSNKTTIGGVGESYGNTVENKYSRGLRGQRDETLGSSIDHSNGIYHIPKPTNYDKAIISLHEQGIEITDEMEEELREAYSDTHLESFDMDTLLHAQRADAGKANGYYTEEEMIKHNQSYTDVNRRNHSNKAGCASRCGSCGGSGGVSLDDYVSYVKAHHEDLKGSSISTPAMKKFINDHARPHLYQTFEDYNDLNSANVASTDHNKLACPDCEHWNEQIGPKGGYISDGVCSHCLGDGRVSRSDPILRQQILLHAHKTPNNTTPEELQAAMKMAEARRLKTGGFNRESDLHTLVNSNLLDPVAMMIGGLQENLYPDIYTREQVLAAKEKAERKRKFAHTHYAIRALENKTSAEEEKATRQIGLQGIGKPSRGHFSSSYTLRRLLHSSGKKSLDNHLNRMLEKLKDIGGDERDIEIIEGTIREIQELDYHDHFLKDDHADEETGEGEITNGHRLVNEIQNMIHKRLKGNRKTQEISFANELYGDKMSDSEKIKQQLFDKNLNLRADNLRHYKGRMLTDSEYEQIKDFEADREATITKTKTTVKNFFRGSGKERLISRAFKSVGSDWDKTKRKYQKEMKEFIEDVNNLTGNAENPKSAIYTSKKSTLNPNDEYLKLKSDHNRLTDSDQEPNNLPQGNVLDESLNAKHGEKAKKWLTRIENKGKDNEKTIPLHTAIDSAVEKKARGEFYEMAKLRATEEFFRQNTNSRLSDYGRLKNREGHPMSLREYLDNDGDDGLDTKSDVADLNDWINELIVDKRGSPIGDIEEGTRGTYFIKKIDAQDKDIYSDSTFKDPNNPGQMITIPGKKRDANMPDDFKSHSYDDNQDAEYSGTSEVVSMDSYRLDEYVQERMQDVNWDLEPVSSQGLDNKLLQRIEYNINHMEELQGENGMSQEEAIPIIEAANHFYDIHHYPNFLMEQKLQEIADENGVELSDLNHLFRQNPELTEPVMALRDHITAIHPTWCPNETVAMKDFDHADELYRQTSKEDKLHDEYWLGDEEQLPLQAQLPEGGGHRNLWNTLDRTKTDKAKAAYEEHQAMMSAVFGDTNQQNEPIGALTEEGRQQMVQAARQYGQSNITEPKQRMIGEQPIDNNASLAQRLQLFAQQQATSPQQQEEQIRQFYG